MNFRLPDGYMINPRPEPFDERAVPKGVSWQPDVYKLAAQLAVEHSCGTLIDVGCGAATKAAETGLRVVGLDRPKVVADLPRDVVPVGCNLETGLPGMLPFEIGGVDVTSSVIVCADVVEHLVDPGPLLSDLGRLCEFAPVVLISTPDRDLVRGPDDLGPPANACHVREWNEEEFRALLADYKIPAEVLHTVDNDQDQRPWTLLAVVERP